MDKIYPNLDEKSESLDLNLEEVIDIKKGLVIAIEKDIESNQDRALDALKGSKLTDERKEQIRKQLYIIFELEKQVIESAQALKDQVEKVYEEKDDAKTLETKIDWPLIVDKEIYSKRFIEAKAGKIETPVISVTLPLDPQEPTPIIEEGEGEITKL